MLASILGSRVFGKDVSSWNERTINLNNKRLQDMAISKAKVEESTIDGMSPIRNNPADQRGREKSAQMARSSRGLSTTPSIQRRKNPPANRSAEGKDIVSVGTFPLEVAQSPHSAKQQRLPPWPMSPSNSLLELGESEIIEDPIKAGNEEDSITADSTIPISDIIPSLSETSFLPHALYGSGSAQSLPSKHQSSTLPLSSSSMLPSNALEMKESRMEDSLCNLVSSYVVHEKMASHANSRSASPSSSMKGYLHEDNGAIKPAETTTHNCQSPSNGGVPCNFDARSSTSSRPSSSIANSSSSADGRLCTVSAKRYPGVGVGTRIPSGDAIKDGTSGPPVLISKSSSESPQQSVSRLSQPKHPRKDNQVPQMARKNTSHCQSSPIIDNQDTPKRTKPAPSSSKDQRGRNDNGGNCGIYSQSTTLSQQIREDKQPIRMHSESNDLLDVEKSVGLVKHEMGDKGIIGEFEATATPSSQDLSSSLVSWARVGMDSSICPKSKRDHQSLDLFATTISTPKVHLDMVKVDHRIQCSVKEKEAHVFTRSLPLPSSCRIQNQTLECDSSTYSMTRSREVLNGPLLNFKSEGDTSLDMVVSGKVRVKDLVFDKIQYSKMGASFSQKRPDGEPLPPSQAMCSLLSPTHDKQLSCNMSSQVGKLDDIGYCSVVQLPSQTITARNIQLVGVGYKSRISSKRNTAVAKIMGKEHSVTVERMKVRGMQSQISKYNSC